MKKLVLVFLLAAVLVSCKKERTPGVQPVDVVVQVSHSINISDYSLPVNGVKVKITNISSGTSQERISDASGKIIFQSLTPGLYDIDATYTIKAADYTNVTNIQTDSDVSFNASEKSKEINASSTDAVELKLIAGTPGQWVIKQVYYAGSNTVDGAGFRDQFIEFYNNTDKVLYADSLYFGQLWGRQSTTGTLNMNILASGQLDWSKSVGMTMGAIANTGHVYMRSLFMLPGNGKQYPVQPGSSIVVAQTALNHKVPFTGNNGREYSARNPELTIDLSGANFEAYYGDLAIAEGGTPFASDIDNPNVPNLEVVSYYGNDMLFDNPGRDGFVIFKVDGTQNVKNWPQYYEPLLATPTSSARKYIQVPHKYILDAIEIQPNTAASRIPKKLPAGFDAGFTFAPKGQYTSQSVIRKTEKTVAGRRILKDTNNSTEDFDFLDLAQPKGFK